MLGILLKSKLVQIVIHFAIEGLDRLRYAAIVVYVVQFVHLDSVKALAPKHLGIGLGGKPLDLPTVPHQHVFQIQLSHQTAKLFPNRPI